MHATNIHLNKSIDSEQIEIVLRYDRYPRLLLNLHRLEFINSHCKNPIFFFSNKNLFWWWLNVFRINVFYRKFIHIRNISNRFIGIWFLFSSRAYDFIHRFYDIFDESIAQLANWSNMSENVVLYPPPLKAITKPIHHTHLKRKTNLVCFDWRTKYANNTLSSEFVIAMVVYQFVKWK